MRAPRTSTKALSRGALAFCAAFLLAVACDRPASPSRADEAARSDAAEKRYEQSRDEALAGDPRGLLTLYAMSKDKKTSGDLHSEAATVALNQFLYINTGLWVRTFSSVDGFRWPAVDSSHLPPGLPEKEFRETIVRNLKRIKGSPQEERLIRELLDLPELRSAARAGREP